MKFAPGEVLVRRHWRGGRVSMLHLVRVAADDERGLRLWLPSGSPYWRAAREEPATAGDETRGRLVRQIWTGTDVMIWMPDDYAFGERLATRSRQRDPAASDAVIEKDRLRFSHAPLVVAVIARLGPDEKIPESERFSTASCVCFALLQAAQALGYGAIWLTGWLAYDAQVASRLGLAADERVAGFIHIGTPKLDAPERERPDPRELLSEWTP